MTALHRKLWRELGQLRGQALAISAVLAAGIATMVMALGNHAALADSRALYYGDQHFADDFAVARRAPLALLEPVLGIAGVRQAQGRVVAYAPLEIEGFEGAVSGRFVSLPVPGDPGLNGVWLRRGRLAVADDEVVVGEAFAQAHGLVPGDRLVAVLNGRRQGLAVVGIGMSPEFVYAIRPGDIFPDFQRFGVFWMARDALAAAYDLDGAFNDLAVALDRGAREGSVIEQLDALLEPYGGLGAHGRDLHVSHRFLDEELDQLRIMAQLFSTIFLGVTAFLLNIVLGRLIAGQREQIAVLRAFGYGRAQVALHYGQLALALVALGILPGLLAGVWLGRMMAGIYTDYYSFPYLIWRLQPGLVLLALGFAAVAATVGTATALARVFALAPAEAMRPESPARYRRSVVERLGAGRLLGPAGRMIARNLGRRPLRTLLSVTGIALAGGILVMARFQAGAIEHLVEVQFGLAQRDDLTVGFVEATGAAAAPAPRAARRPQSPNPSANTGSVGSTSALPIEPLPSPPPVIRCRGVASPLASRSKTTIELSAGAPLRAIDTSRRPRRGSMARPERWPEAPNDSPVAGPAIRYRAGSAPLAAASKTRISPCRSPPPRSTLASRNSLPLAGSCARPATLAVSGPSRMRVGATSPSAVRAWNTTRPLAGVPKP